MFRTLKTLTSASVMASDGLIGRVSSFLFDDRSWNVLYLTLELKSWRERREVVVSINQVEQVDWGKKIVRLSLSKSQVRSIPDIDSARPVNRQQEIALREYFGWPARWGQVAGEFCFPGVPAGREYPVQGKDDPHLRSTEAVDGYEVWGASGRIGRLWNFVVKDQSWHIDFLEAKAGDWKSSSPFVISTQWVDLVSWAKHRVRVSQAEAAGLA
jgi:hypothetical protein